jgi:hypothetical protein
MRTPDRNRCGPALAALCAGLVIILAAILPAAALSADYRVLPNGTAYNASIDVQDASQFDFSETGVMGERVPLTVGNVQLSGTACGNCTFNWSGSSTIRFDPGNYTISFTGPLHESHIQGIFDHKHDINVTLPQEFDIRDPLLATLSPPGSNITRFPDNTTTIRWYNATYFDIRFYDQGREDLLFLFGNFWIVIAVILLVPFLLTMRKNE